MIQGKDKSGHDKREGQTMILAMVMKVDNYNYDNKGWQWEIISVAMKTHWD